MCGIAGQLGAILGKPECAKVLARLAHRGPDGHGVHADAASRLTLFHTRLAILDPTPAASQPMRDALTGNVVVYNGEIYNFRELRFELAARGETFATRSDTEVLLAMYRVHGESMLDRLDGMFAFALWDASRKQLLVARDKFGVKPLYLSQANGIFTFASELKALICFPSVKREIDVQALAHYARLMWCPGPRSPLKDVTKLDPGEALWVRNGAVERRWHFYQMPSPVEQPANRRELEAEVGEALGAAVKRQMVSDVPVGAFLSGGLDSSAIVSHARKHCSGRMQCFTIDFDQRFAAEEGFVRDLPFAMQVARTLDVDLHVVNVGPEMAEHFSDMVWQLDEPEADPAAMNTLAISQLARSKGIKVLLSGIGGDELFAGYRRHLAVGVDWIWSLIPPAITSGVHRLATARSNRSPRFRQLAKMLSIGRYPDRDQRIAAYFDWLQPTRVLSLFHADHAPGLTHWPLVERLRAATPGQSPLRRMMHLVQRYFLADHNLNYGDKMSMAAGVEMRVPFLDPRLVDLAARIPDRALVSGLQTKSILKRALRHRLPREIVYRAKNGFGVPVRAWLRGPLRPMLLELLSPASLGKRGLFDVTNVGSLMADEEAGRGDNAYTLLSLACIELWCRRFVDESDRDSAIPRFDSIARVG
jgi:asparagine synthase (glutamine-hydrolysing)